MIILLGLAALLLPFVILFLQEIRDLLEVGGSDS